MPLDLPPMFEAADLSPAVAQRAERALHCQQQKGATARRFLVADLGRPSGAKRLWVFDVSGPKPALLLEDFVAHGAGSDPEKTGLPKLFGNVPESGRSSLGLYRIGEPYIGVHGRSYRLDGLTAGFNTAARARAVVFHPAGYVRGLGSVGRSLGCPAVRQAVMDRLDREGLADTFLWIDGPDARLGSAAGCDDAPTPHVWTWLAQSSMRSPWGISMASL